MLAASLPRRRTYNITSSSLARQHAQDGISCKMASYTCYPPYIGPDAKPQAGRRRDCKAKERRYTCTPPILQSPPANLPAFVFHYLFFAKNSNQNIGRMEENG